MKKIYASIDIGSYEIKFVVGEYFNHKFYVLASHSCPSKGIKKGLVIDPNLVIESIRDGIKEIKKKLGIEIKKVIVNVPDYNIKFDRVTGSIDIRDDETKEETNKTITSNFLSMFGTKASMMIIIIQKRMLILTQKKNTLKHINLCIRIY